MSPKIKEALESNDFVLEEICDKYQHTTASFNCDDKSMALQLDYIGMTVELRLSSDAFDSYICQLNWNTQFGICCDW